MTCRICRCCGKQIPYGAVFCRLQRVCGQRVEKSVAVCEDCMEGIYTMVENSQYTVTT